MRELRLRYFIDLASNIGVRARSDAQTFEQAQKTMQRAVERSGAGMRELGSHATQAATRLGMLDRVMARWGSNNSAQRQAGYFQRLVQSIDAAESRVRRLGAAMGKLQAGGMAAAGAGYVVKAALDKPVDYDTRLRAVTATAFAGKSIGELRAGRSQINDLVVDAVRRAPGASREKALEAFEKLVGVGSFTYDESRALLPTVMRTAVAAHGTDPNDLVQAAEKMKVNLGLSPDQIGVALAKVMRAGQEGGFEIKDSAKWIGPLMPYMKGYKGMAGVEQLVTMLQQVRATAGTNDEAANNFRNFIQKMGADSTRKDFKKQGFDLDSEMAKGVLAQKTPVETYMALLDKVMQKNDPAGKARAMMAKADKAATPEQRAEQYEEIKRIYEGSAVSKIINDLQEMGGYEGLRRTREYGAKVLAAVQEENGNAVSTGFQFMSEGTGAKMQAAANEKDIAATNAMEKLSGPLSSLLDGATALAREFPGLAASAWGATVALGALSAASVLKGFAGGLGKAGAAGGAATVATTAARTFMTGPLPAAAVPAAMSAGAVGLSMAGGLAAVGAPILAAGMYLDHRANTPEGLRGRIADRGSRIAELQQLIGLEREGGSSQAVARLEHELQQLTSNRDMLQQRLGATGSDGWRGKGFNDPRRVDYVTLTAPGAAPEQVGAGKSSEVKVGEGRIGINVTVRNESVSVVPTIEQQPSLVKLDVGHTNPGSN